MTPQEFKERLAGIGWKQADFVRATGLSKVSVSNWANGHPIPEWASSYLGMAEALQTMIRTFGDDPRLVTLEQVRREIFDSVKAR